jgi:hypothetical protein
MKVGPSPVQQSNMAVQTETRLAETLSGVKAVVLESKVVLLLAQGAGRRRRRVRMLLAKNASSSWRRKGGEVTQATASKNENTAVELGCPGRDAACGASASPPLVGEFLRD